MPIITVFDEHFDRQPGATGALGTTPISAFNDSWHVTSSSGTGSYAKLNNELGVLGAGRLTTGAAINATALMHLNRDYNQTAPSDAMWDLGLLGWFIFDAWIRIPTITSVNVKVGFGQDPASSTFGTAGALFAFDPVVSSAWQMITRTGGAQTMNVSTTVAANTWYWLRIICHSQSCSFFIGGQQRGMHTTHLPTSSGSFGASVLATTASARTLDLDRMRVQANEQ